LFAGFILAVLVAVLLYQLFAPGTAFRYYRCRQGSIDDSDLWFTFTTNDLQIPRVHGIEFTWDKLKKKMDLNFGRINYTGTRKKTISIANVARVAGDQRRG